MDKAKDGFKRLREDVEELRRQSTFMDAEKCRARTVRMLDRLGIAGYSEPGNQWVRISDFEVLMDGNCFEGYQWHGRPLGTNYNKYHSREDFGSWCWFLPLPRLNQASKALVAIADKCSGKANADPGHEAR
jgi:hypothetical protein